MLDLQTILSDHKEEILGTDLSSIVSRTEESHIDLDSPLAQVVTGVRRSGKSTLCKKVLLDSGKTFAYINFDDERLFGIGSGTLNDILEYSYRIYGEFEVLFMDEIQNVDGWHLFVNRILRQGIKVLLTGSNANLLSGELSTYLTGRYNEINLYPFSFMEYCDANNVDTHSASTKAKALRQKALDSYLMEGGLPENMSRIDRKGYTMSLLNAIVRKDVCRRYNVRHTETLWDMANRVLDNFCQTISYTGMAEEFSLRSVHTAKKYIHYLEEAFLIRILSKYSPKSRDRQTVKKVYSVDLAFTDERDNNISSENLGWRLENTVFLELSRRVDPQYQQIYFIKENSFEVDFCIYERGNVRELIQVTYTFDKDNQKLVNREIGGLLKGAAMTGCDNLRLISMNCRPETIVRDGRKVEIMQATDWLCSIPSYAPRR